MNEQNQEAEELQDGIYFNMPEAQYHSIEALSGTGLKKLIVSMLTFWTETYDPTYHRRESGAMSLGKAYHKRILEGKEAFVSSFVKKLSKDDFPNALDTQAELKDYCSKHDLKVTGTKPVLIERIIESDGDMKKNILSLMQDAFNKKHAHQEQMTKADYDEVEKAAEILELSSLSMHFTSGFPEVSIIWHDEMTDVKCKARIDYLRHDSLIELKSFSNSRNKTIETCVSQAIAYERYNVSAVHYMNGLKEIKNLIKAGVCNTDKPDAKEFLGLLSKNEQEFTFVFQESGQVNNCLARKFVEKASRQSNSYWMATQDLIIDTTHKYASFMKSHGKEKAWIEEQKTEYFDDGDFPIFMLES